MECQPQWMHLLEINFTNHFWASTVHQTFVLPSIVNFRISCTFAGNKRWHVGCRRETNHKVRWEISSWKLCRIGETEQRSSNSHPLNRSHPCDFYCQPIQFFVVDSVFSIPTPNSRTFPDSVHVLAIRPSAIFSASSSLVFRVQPRQETTQSGRIQLDPKRARTLRCETFKAAGDVPVTQTPSQKWTSGHCLPKGRVSFNVCVHVNMCVRVNLSIYIMKLQGVLQILWISSRQNKRVSYGDISIEKLWRPWK